VKPTLLGITLWLIIFFPMGVYLIVKRIGYNAAEVTSERYIRAYIAQRKGL
jgi:hypothetical protein